MHILFKSTICSAKSPIFSLINTIYGSISANCGAKITKWVALHKVVVDYRISGAYSRKSIRWWRKITILKRRGLLPHFWAGVTKNKLPAHIHCVLAHYLHFMQPTLGHFAKVKYEGGVITVIIEDLTIFNEKLVEVRCSFTHMEDCKGFYPDQILEVLVNPDAEKEIARLKKVGQPNQYTNTKRMVVPMKYIDGYWNNFE